MSRTYKEAQIKARMSPTFDPGWASATEHQRDLWPAPDRRSKCYCGCGGRWLSRTAANCPIGPAQMGGSSMRRWARDGYGDTNRPGYPRASLPAMLTTGVEG
jgi:hypothetical protein